jgi:ABC-type proline/glycine betaine transport system permease subunit
MTTLILVGIALFLGFASGFYAGIKNASSSKVEKAKSILDQLKGR